MSPRSRVKIMLYTRGRGHTSSINTAFPSPVASRTRMPNRRTDIEFAIQAHSPNIWCDQSCLHYVDHFRHICCKYCKYAKVCQENSFPLLPPDLWHKAVKGQVQVSQNYAKGLSASGSKPQANSEHNIDEETGQYVVMGRTTGTGSTNDEGPSNDNGEQRCPLCNVAGNSERSSGY